jgi:putative copper resistance protein D
LGGSAIRAVTDIAAIVTFGLVVVPRFDAPRYRAELADRASGPLIASSAVWAMAELVRLVVAAAQAAGVSLIRLDVRTAGEFAVGTAAGRSGLICLAAAVAVAVLASTRTSSAAAGVAAAGLAASGLAARSLVGHLSASPVGGVAVVLHSLAAALWCGTLAALVLTVERRGQWARVLPKFSSVSLVCVAVLLVCGVAGAVVTLPEPAALYQTGYGRLLLAKVVVTVALTALAWRNRARWLPAARAHRATADVSHRRAWIELAIMAVALVLAAALAVSG